MLNNLVDENELLKLALDDSGIREEDFPYANMEIYGLGKYIRKYGFYPPKLNLYVSFAHGIYMDGNPPPAELLYSAKYHFINSYRYYDLYPKNKDKKVLVILWPNVFYRKKNNIVQDKTAKGTLAFPSHSCVDARDKSNLDDYIRDLRKLPEEFQPIDICMFWLDIVQGRHKIFLENGFKVYTAGHMFNCLFIERFYSILKNYKYATSNEVGSMLFYSVEMGIPSFIYGNEPEFYFNENNSFNKTGKTDFNKSDELYKKILELFKYPNTEITEEKMNLVKYELGVFDGISRSRMARILYKSLIEHIMKKNHPKNKKYDLVEFCNLFEEIKK